MEARFDGGHQIIAQGEEVFGADSVKSAAFINMAKGSSFM
jgi:hypothetical protein